MFQLSATGPNLCHQLKLSLISHLIDDRLLDAYRHVASTRQHLTQNFNTPAPTALPRFCYLCTKIWNVRKSQV